MAVKKGGDAQIPATLEALCDKGYTYSGLEKEFKARAGSVRVEVKEYIEKNDDGFDLDIDKAKSFTTKNGKVTYKTTTKNEVDTDAIQALIEAGVVTLTTILSCCSFRAKDLKTALGSNFSEVVESTSSQTISFAANSEFKGDIAAKADVIDELGFEVDTVEKAPEKAKKTPKKAKKTLEESIEAAKKAEKPVKSADSDLDDILKS